MNRQPFAVKPATAAAWPANAPVGAVATNHACPANGLAGGAATSPSIVQCSARSARNSASLTVNSFCAWPASVAVLRATQGLGLGGREQRGLRTVGPDHPAQRGFEFRSLIGRAARDHPAFPFDHHRARLDQRGRDDCDPRGRLGFGDRPHPFGPGPGLAEAAPGHHQPHPPVAGGWLLFGSSVGAPILYPGASSATRDVTSKFGALCVGGIDEPVPTIDHSGDPAGADRARRARTRSRISSILASIAARTDTASSCARVERSRVALSR